MTPLWGWFYLRRAAPGLRFALPEPRYDVIWATRDSDDSVAGSRASYHFDINSNTSSLSPVFTVARRGLSFAVAYFVGKVFGPILPPGSQKGSRRVIVTM